MKHIDIRVEQAENGWIATIARPNPTPTETKVFLSFEALDEYVRRYLVEAVGGDSDRLKADLVDSESA